MPAAGRRSCWRRGSRRTRTHSTDSCARGSETSRTCSRSTCAAAARATAPPTGYAMEDHARDVIGLLDALDLDRVVMGGHSFGGLLTYWLAANHPERVERCVVLDAPAGVSPTIMEQIEPSLAAPRPCLRVLGRVPRARSRAAVLRRRRLGRRCRELLSRRRALPAGRHGAGALPARAHPRGGRRSPRPSTGRTSRVASRNRRSSSGLPAASGRPASRRSSPARTRRRPWR